MVKVNRLQRPGDSEVNCFQFSLESYSLCVRTCRSLPCWWFPE